MTKHDAQRIFEATVAVTVLLEADDADRALGEIETRDIDEISAQVVEGDYLGKSRVVSVREISPEHLHARQLALGSDGSRFLAVPGTAEDPEGAILRLQIAQGWSPEHMATVMAGFLRECGLQEAFLGWVRESAEPEAERDPEPEF
ncbi:hypothetical protein [Defluviimonas salinarum]|uniref:Uncharacterized protein n=1 Tax=Defluviimonas salinarum TaxID=2992147 RepID=A0ABT3J9R8_9RHOB|nr:hypothetical protein [Defluviimonas salinarum]MCW3784438.1 hypothetical protein [Defluviimonas salinarum]